MPDRLATFASGLSATWRMRPAGFLPINSLPPPKHPSAAPRGKPPIVSHYRQLSAPRKPRLALLALIPIRHPFGKEINPGLRPRAFPSRWRGRHDRPTDPTNPVVDGGGVRFHVVIAREIERLAHRVNVSLREERENVRVKAR